MSTHLEGDAPLEADAQQVLDEQHAGEAVRRSERETAGADCGGEEDEANNVVAAGKSSPLFFSKQYMPLWGLIFSAWLK